MSVAYARSRYLKVEQVGHPPIDNPFKVILVTLRELDRSLEVLSVSKARDQEAPTSHINRALTALYVLQSSLDFESGGDIASDLFQVYEFVRFHLLRLFRKEENPEIEQASAAIKEILSAWKEIDPSRPAEV